MPTSSQEKQPPKSTKELLALAQDGAKKVFSTDEYREYLKFISGFHQYSVRNQLLIYLQNPHATFVAGYHTWKNQYHRQVNQHEKGIRILAGGEHKYEKRVRQPDGTIKRVKESKVL